MYDPLTMKLSKQVRALTSKLAPDSPIPIALKNARSYQDILNTLSNALTLPALTMSVAVAFRPILLDLCARWIHNDENTEDQLVAICLLIEIHPELFP
jgi:midasin